MTFKYKAVSSQMLILIDSNLIVFATFMKPEPTRETVEDIIYMQGKLYDDVDTNLTTTLTISSYLCTDTLVLTQFISHCR